MSGVRYSRKSRAKRWGVALSSAALTLSLLGCAEANFELAPGSRLPAWFKVPDGLSRNDVTVSILFYTGRFVTMKLWDTHGQKIAQVSTSLRGWEPHTFGPRAAAGGVDDGSYPLYEIVTVGGVTEVIEKRRFSDKWLYVTDDPEVKRKLGL